MKPRGIAVILAIISLASNKGVFAQPRFEIPLTANDGTATFTSYFGILPGASFCIVPQDSMNGHAETYLGPGPPGVFDARFASPRAGYGPCFDVGSPCDYRPFIGYLQRDTFRLNLRYPNTLPVTVSWPSGLSAHFRRLILKDVASGGVSYTVNMLSDTSVAIDHDPADMMIYASGPRTTNDTISVNVQVHSGWNMISNPFDHPIPDNVAGHLFPTLIGHVYDFRAGSGYAWGDVMVRGRGYWGKFPGASTNDITGTGYTSDSITVVAGWNMIGSIWYPVPVDSVYSIPPGIIGSVFFGFGASYSRIDTLYPGKGYFVRITQSGLLVLPGGF